MPLLRQIKPLITATILERKGAVLIQHPLHLACFDSVWSTATIKEGWMIAISSENGGKKRLLKNSALRAQKIGIYKCMGAWRSLACRHRFPSLQHTHQQQRCTVKLKVRSQTLESTEEAFSERDLRRTAITCHLEKKPSRCLILIRC